MVFDWAGDFRMGRGLAESDGAMGYIDASFAETGEWAISPRFELKDAGDQPAFGFYDGLARARDDTGKFLPEYMEGGILEDDPFISIDEDGIGKLMRIATVSGRHTRPNLKVGICGEHGGDPKSIRFCASLGFDYVSCSPFRVPIARLAAAHAVLKEAGGTERTAREEPAESERGGIGEHATAQADRGDGSTGGADRARPGRPSAPTARRGRRRPDSPLG